MNQNDNRRHPRLKHRAKIRVVRPSLSELFFANMLDFSESGLFLACSPECMPEIDAILEIQTTEIEDAPVRATKVVRVDPDIGFGVEFI